MEAFGLTGSSSLVLGDGDATSGLAYADVLDLASEADLLVNISGNVHVPEVLGRVRKKVYVDLDPGFTQFWHVSGNQGARLAGHDMYFTVGENIGTSLSTIPTGGLDWRAAFREQEHRRVFDRGLHRAILCGSRRHIAQI